MLTVAEIEKYGGFKDCIWEGAARTRVYAIDAGFGGDPCVRTWLDFGREVNGQEVIRFGDQKVIPILLSSDLSAEKQIARFAKVECDALGIPYSNVFFDAGMYATLAIEMGRVMSPAVNAINFGGTATDRPVSSDMLMFDQKTQTRRLKTWHEHVSKFVTELAFRRSPTGPMPTTAQVPARGRRGVWTARMDAMSMTTGTSLKPRTITRSETAANHPIMRTRSLLESRALGGLVSPSRTWWTRTPRQKRTMTIWRKSLTVTIVSVKPDR